MSQNLDLFGVNDPHPFDKPGQIDFTKVFCCPRCGSTDLASKALVSVIQSPEGEWKVVINNENGALDYAMRNVNNSVECTNPGCGPLYDDTGKPMPFYDEDGAFAYFKNERQLPEDFTLEQLRDDNELEAEFSAFVDTLHNEPWSGTIGECNTL